MYVASGVAIDREMKKELISPRDRDSYPVEWVTIEQSRHFEQLIPQVKEGDDGILWDCVTTWFANELYRGQYGGSRKATI